MSNYLDNKILELSLNQLSEAFDELISACTDADGNPKIPDKRSVMKARGFLPPYCKNALGGVKRHKQDLL